MTAAGAAAAQFAPPGTGGVAALATALAPLGAERRVLVIGAHPDDEDSDLLTYLSRGLGARVAYLSLSRGEGGQNAIGAELGPELGILRTEELLAARREDGAEQFFARAYDFGYSKSAAETFRFWPEDSLVADVLTVLRRFRPQILVSIFSGTPRDGHGQHQVSGIVTRQVFELLRDSSWGPVKLYRAADYDTTGATLRFDAGRLDPVLGRSYHQIAMAGRSRHRSQDMGQLEPPGPRPARLGFIAWRDARRDARDGPSLFSGVDTVLDGTGAYATLVDSARARLSPEHPDAIVPLLARARTALRNADPDERERVEQALAAAAGVAIDATTDQGIVIPGDRLTVEASVWNAGTAAVTVDGLELTAPPGWRVEPPAPASAAVRAASVATARFTVTVAPEAPRTQPYFLRRPRVGALYDWSDVPAAWRGLPFEPPLLELAVRLTLAGQHVTLRREVVWRRRDPRTGEVRRPVFVTRPFDVMVRPELVVWPIAGAASGPRRFTISVTNRAPGPARAAVVLTMPPGWPPVAPESLSFAREGEEQSVTVMVGVPPGMRPGTYTLTAAAVASSGRSEGALGIIDYPHIRPRAVTRPSSVELRAAALALPALTQVGYVRGAADRVPEALAAVGVPIALLDPDTLARGDLGRYDAIVVGSRAYETDAALVAANTRLLDYARSGGLLIVQYQQYPFVLGNFAPYRLSIARPHDRVTDETAPVTLLQPASAVFHVPNEIGPADWEGWVQERGLYFAHDWDPAYMPLVEMHDPGDPPLEGGLLVARVGRGTYVYTGLAFFRELPAGVPGAYRLFANLLGLAGRHAS